MVFMRIPRSEGNWREHLSRTPEAEQSAERFTITPVKDWSYAREGPTQKPYRAFDGTFDDLRAVWFVVEPSSTTDWIGHTLLLFELTGDRLLGVSVEARLEKKEKWTAFRGLWNRFELFYLWASAKDLLTTRAVFLNHRVYVYPLTLEDARERQLLQGMLKTTADLTRQPRFYNTLHSNCTNELAKRAGIGWHYSFVVTGKAADQLYHEGLIPGASFAEAKARADVTELLKRLNNLESTAFDAALLAELRARAGAL